MKESKKNPTTCFRAVSFRRILVLTVLLFVFSIASVCGGGSGAGVAIKLSTLAPEGSTWMNLMHEMDDEIAKATEGRVTFRFYPGGISGDEKDMLRKAKIGQIHAMGLTGNGLGNVVSEVRVLEIPFLFKSYDEVDYVIKQFSDYFRGKFREKGFEILGWADVGFVYLFSNKPVRGIGDMEGIKMWSWEGDPLAMKTFKAFNISTIPIAVPDVLTSLQTKLIDTVYISPMACLALQWFTKVSHMTDHPLTHSCGAVLVKKKVVDKLSPEDRKALFEIADKYFQRLEALTRKENFESIEAMEESGIILVAPSEKDIGEFEAAGVRIADSLVGELFPQELLDRMRRTVADYSAVQKKEN